jgi:hypothetical protein
MRFRFLTRSFASKRLIRGDGVQKLNAEELNHLKSVSARILSDKICEVTPSESKLFLYPSNSLFKKSKYLPAIFDTIGWMLFRRNTAALRLVALTKERISK